MDGARSLVHATAIAVGRRAALIRGPSGSGKSDLALRCLAVPVSGLVPRPARLVADDQCHLSRSADTITVTSPEAIRGRLEVRGLGILDVPCVAEAELALVIDLIGSAETYERLPDRSLTVEVLGLPVAWLALSAFEGSAALKVLLALSDHPQALNG
ncbi:MAG: HPr kinase/phosphorylase [Hyphomicrobium sp.]